MSVQVVLKELQRCPLRRQKYLIALLRQGITATSRLGFRSAQLAHIQHCRRCKLALRVHLERLVPWEQRAVQSVAASKLVTQTEKTSTHILLPFRNLHFTSTARDERLSSFTRLESTHLIRAMIPIIIIYLLSKIAWDERTKQDYFITVFLANPALTLR
jgi:hypothetical protein